jgi:cytochrome c553
MLSQLKKFKSGVRGGANDTAGAMMAGMANSLVDEQAMKDVVAYIRTLTHTEQKQEK